MSAFRPGLLPSLLVLALLPSLLGLGAWQLQRAEQKRELLAVHQARRLGGRVLGAQLLQADLAKIGIRAEIRVIEWGELIRRAKAGEHDLLFMGWAGDNGDPDNFLTPQFSCAALESGLNFARYCDPQLDRLISGGKTTSEQAIRSALYRQAQEIIQRQALWLPLAHPTAFALTRKEVEGYRVSPFGRQDFARVRIAP